MAVIDIALEVIDDNPYNPRKHYPQAKVKEMAQSLWEVGLRQVPEGRHVDGRVQLAYGHMRKRGYLYNQKKDPERWKMMPVNVKEISDQDMFHFSMEENLRRTDITPIEVARCIEAFSQMFPDVTEKNLGEKHGMSEANVSNMKRVLRLPEKILEKIDDGTITFTQGRELLIFEPFENAENLMRSALDGLKTGNKAYGHTNTVEGMQLAVHDVVGNHCRPLDKQWEGYRWDILFDTRAVGCLDCENMIRTHPTKSATAHWCLNPECWEKKQNEHREKAAAAAKAKMQAEVINHAVQMIAQEEKAPAPVMIDENTILVDQETFAKIEASYSADRISEGTAVRRPVEFEGKLYVATSGGMGKVEAYHLVPGEEFTGAPRTYRIPAGREYKEYYESLRNDPNGFYHGMLVKHGKEAHVLVGPEVTFVTKVDEGDFSQEKSVQWRCGQCNVYFEFSPPRDNSKALVECPSCQYEYVTYRRADGVLFCLPKHNYGELPKVKIPSTLLSAADEEQLEARADERDRQMEEARERANLERPVGELPCDSCAKGQTCDRSFFYVADDDSGRLVCDQWECDHVSWATRPVPTEIPEDILALAKEKAGTRAEVLDLNDLCVSDPWRRQLKSGYALLKGGWGDDLRYIDDPEECTERCTQGFHYGFDSKSDRGEVYFICTNSQCVARKKAAFTRAKNAAGQARKKAEMKAIKEAIAQTNILDRPRIKLILLAQMDGYHTQRYYYGGGDGKNPETWLWERLSAGTPAIERKREDLFKRIDKLTDEELAKLVVEFMFYFLQDHGDIGTWEIKTETPLSWLGIKSMEAAPSEEHR